MGHLQFAKIYLYGGGTGYITDFLMGDIDWTLLSALATKTTQYNVHTQAQQDICTINFVYLIILNWNLKKNFSLRWAVATKHFIKFMFQIDPLSVFAL